MLWYKLPLKKQYDLVIFLKTNEVLANFTQSLQILENLLSKASFSWHICIVESGVEPSHEKYILTFCNDSYSYLFMNEEIDYDKIAKSFDLKAILYWMYDSSCLLYGLSPNHVNSFFNETFISSIINFTSTAQYVSPNLSENIRQSFCSQKTNCLDYVKSHCSASVAKNDCCFLTKDLQNIDFTKTSIFSFSKEISLIVLDNTKTNGSQILEKKTEAKIVQDRKEFLQDFNQDAIIEATEEITSLPTCHVINLPHRKDRKNFFTKCNQTFPQEFVDAIDRRPRGSQGRIESYRKILQNNEMPLLWIAEDDVQFSIPSEKDLFQVLSQFQRSTFEIWIVQGEYTAEKSSKSKPFKNITSLIKCTSMIIKERSKNKLIEILDQHQTVSKVVEFCQTCCVDAQYAIERPGFSDIQNKLIK